ncbi:transmembrane and coiled-coil domain protein 3-like [Mustelus asterias]
MPGDVSRTHSKSSKSFHKVNQVLAKGVKQLFANQRGSLLESNGLQLDVARQHLQPKSSLLQSYVVPSDDDLSLSVPVVKGNAASNSSLRPHFTSTKPEAQCGWLQDHKGHRSLCPPTVRPHFIPKGGRKSPEVPKEMPVPQAALSPRPMDPQAFQPLEFLNNQGVKGPSSPPPPPQLPPKLSSEDMHNSYLGSDQDSDDVKGKSKIRVDESRRFTISNTFSRMRGLMKDKADQLEVASLGPMSCIPEETPSPPSPSQEDIAMLEGLRAEIALFQQKVLKITEEIRVKQTHRSANVSEYLRLISHTDRAQAFRLKEAFEKKNQYLSSIISQLQRRLEHYVKRQQQLEQEVTLLQDKASSLQAMHSLQQVGSDYTNDDNHSDSPHLSEASITRANLLVPSESETQGISHHKTQKSAFNNPYSDTDPLTIPDDEYSFITSYSENFQELLGLNFEGKTSRDNSLERHNLGYLSMLEELTEIKETQLNLELDFKNIAEQYNQHYAAFEESLHEEKYRSNQLQAQLNDLIDLHQNEVLNLKSELASLEEKIAYQSYESSRDIWEVLENFQSKLIQLEQQQQQGELLDHVNTRELLGKSMNLLLIIFAMLLMLISTISALVLPFIKTRMRTVSTAATILLLVLIWHNWESLISHPVRRLIFRWR